VTQKQKVAQSVRDRPKTIKTVAEETDILEPNIRRILGVGTKTGEFKRIARGVYVLSKKGKNLVYVHAGDAIKVLPKLARQGFKADMVFLDIPYKTPAVTGGNRGIRYEHITPDDFGKVVSALSVIVRNRNTPVFYMFSQAESGRKKMLEYTLKLLDKFLPVACGEYRKLEKNGYATVRNMRGDIVQPEGILLVTKSGRFKRKARLNFRLIRPKGWQTEKPAKLLKTLIEMSTKRGDMVLDPFAGSGVTGVESLKLRRLAYLIEKNLRAVEDFIMPGLQEVITCHGKM
jgi:16S rRNA G966 N2-methylase RsmD